MVVPMASVPAGILSRGGSRRNVCEIGSKLGVVAGRQAPLAACLLDDGPRVFHQCDDAGDKSIRPDHQRIVMHHEGTIRRHSFDDALDMAFVEPAGERQDEGAEFSIDAIAELDDERRVAGGQNLVFGHRGSGVPIYVPFIMLNRQ